MKKVLLVLCLCVIILAVIATCDSGNRPTLYVVDGAYNCTPQQFIDTINQGIEDTGDSRYCKIPDYVASGEEIKIIGTGLLSKLSLTFYTNDEGMITKIEVDRDTFEETFDSFNTYVLIISSLFNSISADNADAIFTKLDFDNPSTNEYTTTASDNGTKYTYHYLLKGMYQYLTIEPEAD